MSDIVLWRVVEQINNDEANSSGEANAFRYFFISHFTTFLVQIIAKFIVVEHERRDS